MLICKSSKQKTQIINKEINEIEPYVKLTINYCKDQLI